MTHRYISLAFLIVPAVGGTSFAYAQAYPTKPIRIVTGAAAGGADFVARLMAAGLTADWGQQVIVDNRGNGSIPAEIVSKAPPDGYTLLLNGSNIWLLPLLQDDVPYDPLKDLMPVTMAASLPAILVVTPTVPATSVKELIAVAKAHPGALNYASGPTGSSNHLGAELFKAMAHVNLVRIFYKGTAAAVTDLIGGQVQVMFATASAVTPHIKSGRLRALAITSAQPSALFPDLPTVAASGLPGYESATRIGIFVPPKTPVSIVNRLNQEVANVLKSPAVKEKFVTAGAEAVASSPSEFAAQMKSEMAVIGKLIKDAGIRAE